MAEKFDKLVKICEEVCKKQFAEYEKNYMEFVESYTKGIALTATYSATVNGKSWPKDFFKDSPNPGTYGDLFKWLFDKEYGSKYYDQKDVVGGDVSVYIDDITGKEYQIRIEAADRVPMAPEKPDDKGLPDDIIESAVAGNAEIAQIYKILKRYYRRSVGYLIYKKILQEITVSVYSEKVVKQYLERLTPEGIRTWTPEKFSEIWRDGLQGKSISSNDVGIADFVGREYPLYQEIYGGNFWVVIDNPWSKRENPEGPQALADAIREKSSDPDANNPKGTTASEASTGASASDAAAAGPSASTPLKYKPFVEGLADGFQIQAKMDLPDFKIFVGNPDEWKALDPVDPEAEGGQLFDENGEPDEFTEEAWQGGDTDIWESQVYESPEVEQATKENAALVNEKPRGETYENYTPGKHKLDMLPGEYVDNDKRKIKLCQIHEKPVNVAIADAVLDLIEAAAKDGVTVVVRSGFRPAFDPNLSAKSEGGVKVSAQSQEDLVRQNCSGSGKNRKCNPDTAPAGSSRHGNGIAIDFNTGARSGKFKPLNTKVYTWMVKNSWKFGFIRAVKSEEWHYEYWPEAAKSGGPYGKLSKSNPLFFSDLGLNDLKAPNYA